MPAAVSGKYSLHMRAEHEIATDFPEHDVIVKPDEPPQFKKVAGKDELKVVLPYDKIPLEFKVGDDVAVAKAEVEYRVNHGDPALVAVNMTGFKRRMRRFPRTRSTWRARSAGHVVGIASGARPTTCRRSSAGRTSSTIPADHALTLHIATDKEILALRDDVNKRLEKIKADLKAGDPRWRLQDAQRLTRPGGPVAGPGRGRASGWRRTTRVRKRS